MHLCHAQGLHPATELMFRIFHFHSNCSANNSVDLTVHIKWWLNISSRYQSFRSGKYDQILLIKILIFQQQSKVFCMSCLSDESACIAIASTQNQRSFSTTCSALLESWKYVTHISHHSFANHSAIANQIPFVHHVIKALFMICYFNHIKSNSTNSSDSSAPHPTHPL